MDIDISRLDETTFEVTVAGKTATSHTVTLDPAYHLRLTNGRVSQADLVRLSFEFLLEREPNTSILSSFDLSAIGRYFHGFEQEISRVLRQ